MSISCLLWVGIGGDTILGVGIPGGYVPQRDGIHGKGITGTYPLEGIRGIGIPYAYPVMTPSGRHQSTRMLSCEFENSSN